jgi:hypothetical protein
MHLSTTKVTFTLLFCAVYKLSMEPLLNTDAAAELLGVLPTTLRDWRSLERGPPYIKVSPKCIRYAPEDLIKWRDERRHVPSVQGVVDKQTSRILKGC